MPPAYLHKHTVHTFRYEINMTDMGGHNYHVKLGNNVLHIILCKTDYLTRYCFIILIYYNTDFISEKKRRTRHNDIKYNFQLFSNRMIFDKWSAVRKTCILTFVACQNVEQVDI